LEKTSQKKKNSPEQKLKHNTPRTVQQVPPSKSNLGPKTSKQGPTHTPTLHTTKAYIEKIQPRDEEDEVVRTEEEITMLKTPVVL
jgi:hypothetical protein